MKKGNALCHAYVVLYLRKPATFTTGRRLRSSSLDTDSSETSSVHDDRILPRQKAKRGTVIVHSQNTVSGEEVAMTKTGRSGRGTNHHQK